MAQAPHEATEKNKNLVLSWALDGQTHTDIAEGLGISLPTLYKYYREQLDEAEPVLTAQVKGALFENATKHNNVSAQIFWLKARANWSEKMQLEHSGAVSGQMIITLPSNGREADVTDTD